MLISRTAVSEYLHSHLPLPLPLSPPPPEYKPRRNLNPTPHAVPVVRQTKMSNFGLASMSTEQKREWSQQPRQGTLKGKGDNLSLEWFDGLAFGNLCTNQACVHRHCLARSLSFFRRHFNHTIHVLHTIFFTCMPPPPGISCFQSFRLRSVNWPKCLAATFVSKVPTLFGDRVCIVQIARERASVCGDQGEGCNGSMIESKCGMAVIIRAKLRVVGLRCDHTNFCTFAFSYCVAQFILCSHVGVYCCMNGHIALNLSMHCPAHALPERTHAHVQPKRAKYFYFASLPTHHPKIGNQSQPHLRGSRASPQGELPGVRMCLWHNTVTSSSGRQECCWASRQWMYAHAPRNGSCMHTLFYIWLYICMYACTFMYVSELPNLYAFTALSKNIHMQHYNASQPVYSHSHVLQNYFGRGRMEIVTICVVPTNNRRLNNGDCATVSHIFPLHETSLYVVSLMNLIVQY